MRTSATTTTTKAIRCASCSKRIRGHEPDLLLEDVVAGGGKPRYYHERCSAAAYTAAARRPGAYLLTVRHVDPSRN